jgi:hypothetical protein
MRFKSDAQRKAMMANIFSKGFMNRFAESPNYDTGEGMNVQEMQIMEKHPYFTGEQKKSFIESTKDVMERAKIQASGLNALGSIPAMLPDDESRQVASYIVKPYVAGEIVKLNLATEAEIYRPIYRAILNKQAEDFKERSLRDADRLFEQERKKEKSTYDAASAARKFERESFINEKMKQDWDSWKQQADGFGRSRGPQYEVKFKR